MIDKLSDSLWTQKGETFSDKSARTEFGLTQDEIIACIKSGKFQFRENHIHGNPYFRLLRQEVEAYVIEKYGKKYLEKKKIKKELSQVNSKLRKLKIEISSIEERKTELMKLLEDE